MFLGPGSYDDEHLNSSIILLWEFGNYLTVSIKCYNNNMLSCHVKDMEFRKFKITVRNKLCGLYLYEI